MAFSFEPIMRTETPKGAWFMITATRMAQRMKMIIGTGNPEQGAVAQEEDRRRKAANDPAAGGIDGNSLDRGHCAKRHQDRVHAQKRYDHAGDQSNQQGDQQTPPPSASAITPATACGGLSGPNILVRMAAMTSAERFAVAMIGKVEPSAHQRDHHRERQDAKFGHLESHRSQRLPGKKSRRRQRTKADHGQHNERAEHRHGGIPSEQIR